MKNLISILIIGWLVMLAPVKQVMAGHTDRHPVWSYSGSGSSETASGTSELVSAAYPETTISATASSTIESSSGEIEPTEKTNFFARNWGVLVMGLLGFADLVTRLTPTEKDNSIVNFLVSVLNAVIPNLKKGGGRL